MGREAPGTPSGLEAFRQCRQKITPLPGSTRKPPARHKAQEGIWGTLGYGLFCVRPPVGGKWGTVVSGYFTGATPPPLLPAPWRGPSLAIHPMQSGGPPIALPASPSAGFPAFLPGQNSNLPCFPERNCGRLCSHRGHWTSPKEVARRGNPS